MEMNLICGRREALRAVLFSEAGEREASLPKGATLAWESSDPEVAKFVPGSSKHALDGHVEGGIPGHAILSMTVTLADGSSLIGKLPITVFELLYSMPGRVIFEFGLEKSAPPKEA